MKKIVSLLLLLMAITSCTNDLETPEISFPCGQEKDIVLLDGSSFTKSTNDQSDNILQFKNQTVLNETISSLKKMTNEERLEWEKKMNFISLNSVYEKALDEVTAMEGTAEEYNDLKEKYQSYLYFPEYKEDYGAYLPVSNEEVASVLNKNGKVIVGEEIVDMKDIFEYRDLQLTGNALYDLEVLPRLSNKDYIGSQYDSGWKEFGKRKCKLKAGRRIMNVSKTEIALHIEISFRKKGLFGWMNYKETTQTTGTYAPPGGPLSNNFYQQETGRSSHDHYVARGSSFWWEQGIGKKRAAKIGGSFTVKYVGFNVTMNYNFELPETTF
ncbi:DUF4848 domain-containing protein [Parabacteroides faecis]|uniref:DUF4848 domain-containing protein n=1 Tax=Parabacteroides faecis TaxID=1217282 RepID=UPI0035216D89